MIGPNCHFPSVASAKVSKRGGGHDAKALAAGARAKTTAAQDATDTGSATDRLPVRNIARSDLAANSLNYMPTDVECWCMNRDDACDAGRHLRLVAVALLLAFELEPSDAAYVRRF